MTEEEVVTLMYSATSENDWYNKCAKVKEACNGYPDFWFSAIFSSGLAAEVESKW